MGKSNKPDAPAPPTKPDGVSEPIPAGDAPAGGKPTQDSPAR